MSTIRHATISLSLFALISLSACQTSPPKNDLQFSERTIVFPANLPPQTKPTPQSHVWDVSDIDISHIDDTRKLVALTFDDAPQNMLENLLAVFALFNQEHPTCTASATVFCNGRLIHNENRHSLSAAYAMGWELANHAFSHTDLTTLAPQEQYREIADTDAILQEIDNKPLHLFRPPFGKIDSERKQSLSTPVINWNIDTLDWVGKSADEIQTEVLQNLSNGAIVLMHDSNEHTVDAVKALLPALYERGYQAVTVSAMAKAHGVALKNGGEYIRIRKNRAN